jgi:hypothetical protein
MHYAKASSLHGVAMTAAAAFKEVINIFDVFKAVHPVRPNSLSVLIAKYPGMVVHRGPKYRHLAYDIVYDMATGVVEESQTAFSLELLKANNITGKERNPARTTLLTAREYPKPLSHAEHSQYRSVLQGIGATKMSRLSST